MQRENKNQNSCASRTPSSVLEQHLWSPCPHSRPHPLVQVVSADSLAPLLIPTAETLTPRRGADLNSSLRSGGIQGNRALLCSSISFKTIFIYLAALTCQLWHTGSFFIASWGSFAEAHGVFSWWAPELGGSVVWLRGLGCSTACEILVLAGIEPACPIVTRRSSPLDQQEVLLCSVYKNLGLPQGLG